MKNLKNRFALLALALLIVAGAGVGIWQHYKSLEDQYVFEDEDIEIRPDQPGWKPRAKPAVPRIRARDLALNTDMDTRTRKATFFNALRPIVQEENARIAEHRGKLLAAHAADETAPWIAELAKRYRVEWTGNEWEALLARVDTVPLMLVLVQSANESSWGRSRFAREGNNMFGMWCFSPGCGIVPERRGKGKTHEVAAYKTINASVRAYLHTINTVGAYKDLRQLRARLRARGRRLDAVKLAGGLLRYSERGEDYVDEIRDMIRVNAKLIRGKPKSG